MRNSFVENDLVTLGSLVFNESLPSYDCDLRENILHFSVANRVFSNSFPRNEEVSFNFPFVFHDLKKEIPLAPFFKKNQLAKPDDTSNWFVKSSDVENSQFIYENRSLLVKLEEKKLEKQNRLLQQSISELNSDFFFQEKHNQNDYYAWNPYFSIHEAKSFFEALTEFICYKVISNRDEISTLKSLSKWLKISLKKIALRFKLLCLDIRSTFRKIIQIIFKNLDDSHDKFVENFEINKLVTFNLIPYHEKNKERTFS
ncbi:MAG: hypothetical protein A2W85_13330 [Bacteroidetes bacterium GWF2_41_31]|nr:MAG: hypothetical protein A2W85_13330 [Bacteroidetes bacterium GWF2_41_31]